MKYEVSNIVFKTKPSDKKMSKKYPFKRGKEMVRLIEDTPQNLYMAYNVGLSFKPHPFREETLNNANVHSIVLDFDHLTKAQLEFIKKKVGENPTIYGDYSAGTKVRLYENRDIPNYENPKWGYKVFYPVNCLCTWKELNDAFIGAVSFFNPNFNSDKVLEVWAKWLKANNRKDEIANPIFKDWILPDVAMLNSFRTQITYGVRPELKKDKKLDETDFPTNSIYSVFAYPAGGIQDYSGLEWRPEEAVEDKKNTDEKIVEAWVKYIEPVLSCEIQSAKQDPNDLKLSIPTSRSMVARRLKKQSFADLAWDDKSNAILNARVHAREIDYDKAKSVMVDSARTLTRDLLEMEWQRNNTLHRRDALKNNLHALIHDILVVARQRCGLKLLENRGIDADLKKKVCLSIFHATDNFPNFRMRLKLKHLEAQYNPPHLDLLRQYCQTKDKSLLAEYNKMRKGWVEENKELAKKTDIPYTYRKKGLKKWLVNVANVDLTKEELELFGFEPARLKDEKDWLEWCQNILGTRKDDLNDVSEEDLKKWYKDYKREYNKKWGVLEGTIRKDHKQHKSKWSEMFSGKTKEEITDIIDHLEVSKQMKYKLRKLRDQYGR